MHLITETMTVHITSLEDLHMFLQLAHQPVPRPLRSEDSIIAELTQLRHLSITLRLSMQTFKEVASYHKDPQTPTSGHAAAWLQLCPALSDLPRLRTLRLWIDHDRMKSWSLVNERAFFAPVESLIASKPDLQVTVNLPMSNPKWESPTRHFIPGSPPAPFTITRRLRQWYHATNNYDGRPDIRIEKDFPTLYGDESSDDSLETAERYERHMWEIGRGNEVSKVRLH